MKKLFTVHNTEKWLNILICKELLKINKKKNKRPNRKMGIEDEQAIHRKNHMNKHEKEHNITHN